MTGFKTLFPFRTLNSIYCALSLRIDHFRIVFPEFILKNIVSNGIRILSYTIPYWILVYLREIYLVSFSKKKKNARQMGNENRKNRDRSDKSPLWPDERKVRVRRWKSEPETDRFRRTSCSKFPLFLFAEFTKFIFEESSKNDFPSFFEWRSFLINEENSVKYFLNIKI